MAPTIKAVVFDLDGLMFNTEDIFNLSGAELLRRRSKVLTQECLHAMLGRRPREAFAVMAEKLDLDEPIDLLMAESQEIFEGLLDEHLAPMPGLFELLELIETRNLPKGVATSSPRDYLDGMLKRYELLHRFPVTLAAEDVARGKPHPEIYERAAAEIGIAPDEMLVLEDSEAGTRSAADAGAIVVSIPHDRTRLQDFQAAYCIAESLTDSRILQLFGD